MDLYEKAKQALERLNAEKPAMNIIEIEQLEPGTSKVKNAPRITVRASDCYHPTSYGRDINRHHVNRIAAVFDFNKVGEITIVDVSSEDGRYEINDGNHRHQAMISKFGANVEFTATLLPPGLTIEQRAYEYTMRNRNRAPMKPVDLFKADVVMRDRNAMDIKQICEETGCGIHGYNIRNTHYPNITSMRDLYVLHKAGNLKQVIRIIRSAYDGAPLRSSDKAMTAHMLRAVNKCITFFKNDSKFREQRLIDTLARYEAKYWVGIIMKDAQFSSEGVNALVQEYNHRLTKPYRLFNPNIFLMTEEETEEIG